METLTATAPHYVRCLKPNALKRPAVFDNDLVLNQLRYAGMMETIKIRYWIVLCLFDSPFSYPMVIGKPGFRFALRLTCSGATTGVSYRRREISCWNEKTLRYASSFNISQTYMYSSNTYHYHYFILHKMVKKALKILLEGLKAQGLTNATDLQIGKTKIFMRDSQVSLSRSATSQHMIY
jgi:hypothetical protein